MAGSVVPALGRRQVEIALDMVRKGGTLAVAARAAGLGYGELKRALELSPDLSAEVSLAQMEAVGAVEQRLYLEAIGERTEAEEAYERRMEEYEREMADRSGAPVKPRPPKDPSLKAAEMFLQAHDPRYRKGGEGNGGGVGVAVQVNLGTEDGRAEMRRVLEERREAAEAGGVVVDAEVVDG